MSHTLYNVLGVDDDADAATIKEHYRRYAQRRHPDKPGGDESKFKETQLAYEVLSNPVRRKAYDESGTTDKAPQIEDVALDRVMNVFKAVMEEYPNGDMVEHARVMVTGSINNLLNMMQAQENRKAKLIKRSTRIKLKRVDGVDLYRQLMVSEIMQCTRTLDEMDHEIEVNRLVRSTLADYEDVDPTGANQ